MDLTFLSSFINADKIGGWVRAGVASGLGFLIAHYAAKYPVLTNILSPEVQAAVGVAASGAVVGLWSHLTKTDEAKIAAVAAMPDVEKIVVQPKASDGVGAALADPAQMKVVSK